MLTAFLKTASLWYGGMKVLLATSANITSDLLSSRKLKTFSSPVSKNAKELALKITVALRKILITFIIDLMSKQHSIQ